MFYLYLKVCSHDPILSDPINFWRMFYILLTSNVHMGSKSTKANAVMLYQRHTTFHASEVNWIGQNWIAWTHFKENNGVKGLFRFHGLLPITGSINNPVNTEFCIEVSLTCRDRHYFWLVRTQEQVSTLQMRVRPPFGSADPNPVKTHGCTLSWYIL